MKTTQNRPRLPRTAARQASPHRWTLDDRIAVTAKAQAEFAPRLARRNDELLPGIVNILTHESFSVKFGQGGDE